MQQSRDYCVLAYSTWHIILSEIKLQVTIHESLHYLSNTYISRSLHFLTQIAFRELLNVLMSTILSPPLS